ncbi:SGNH/GDSL hydrolase family protein [Geminisphaera colitermitum]|uniref:SGNH/GDSL hydrolase family protein n=1 Tax=Geminisphaera colitermitum TaxID=1148786 RepID=UPI000158CAE8|nr:SGNH/GDSL hydrolase family protein [Geminisphaera colitermitum]
MSSQSASLHHNEPVLFTRSAYGTPAEAFFLLPPRKLLRVHSSDATLKLVVSDFRIDGRKITYTGTEKIPSFSEKELFPAEKTARSIGHHTDGKRHLLFSEGRYFYDQQIRFDYETDERWTLPGPSAHSRSLPHLSRLATRIAEGRPITVVLLGDSISAGANAVESPRYIEQFCDRLRTLTTGEVTLHNLSKGGMSTPWGVEQAAQAAALRPDLFIVAFGMNDASGKYPPENYAANVRRMIAMVIDANPNVECAVVSGMNANPAWHLARPEFHQAYHEQLKKLADARIVFCDVFTPWNHLVARKGFVSVTGNGVNHPNDYGHRLYADVLTRDLLPDTTQEWPPPALASNSRHPLPPPPAFVPRQRRGHWPLELQRGRLNLPR